MYKSGGFTIIEVIVVCIVIGILVGIGTIGWSSSLTAGRDRTREIEQQDWVKRFQTYKQRYNLFPSYVSDSSSTALNARYCLGTGFPSGQCGGGSTTATEAASTGLMTQLAKIGTLPEFKHTAAKGYTGPWADYSVASRIRIFQAYEGTSCPTDTTNAAITGATVCYVDLAKN